MIRALLKFSVTGFAFLLTSCAVNEQAVESQNNSIRGLDQIVGASRNSNSDDTNTRTAETKPVDHFAHLRPEHREVLQQWLKSRPFLRPAVEEIDSFVYQLESKSDFEGNMKFVRDTVGENGHQYYSVGDMNHDGSQDFAVLLADSRKRMP